MSEESRASNLIRSYLLVGVQFLLIAFLVWYGGVFGGILSNILLVLGLLLGLWAVMTMHFRVSIFPEVRSGQQLFTGGPYQFIRHPMYTAVLLATFSWVMHRIDIISLFAWFCLLIDLMIKLVYEERLLREKFSDYEAYATRSKRLIPWIY